MKKLLWFALLVTSMFTVTAQQNPAGYQGLGTANNPYKIGTAQDLNNLRQYTGATYANTYFELINDIDLEEFGEWMPIGEWGNSFDGKLNGNNHIIKKLTISERRAYNALFARLGNTALIKNLGLECVNINGWDWAGALAAINFGNIQYCFSTGEVYGIELIGGLVGDNRGEITFCYSHSAVTGAGSGKGGLAGGNYNKIEKSFSTGYVDGDRLTGGFVGSNKGTISQCYFDKERSTWSYGMGREETNKWGDILPKTTREMKRPGTFLWFDSSWDLIPFMTYPFFRWQLNQPELNCNFSGFNISENASHQISATENLSTAHKYSSKNINDSEEILIYPNPFANKVNIRSNKNTDVIEIYNTNGILLKKTTETEIDMSSYPNGVYIFNINGETRKVTKQ